MKYTSVDRFRDWLQVTDTLNTTFETARNRRLAGFIDQAESEIEDFLGHKPNMLDIRYEHDDFTVNTNIATDSRRQWLGFTQTGSYSVQPNLQVRNKNGNYNNLYLTAKTNTGSGSINILFNEYIQINYINKYYLQTSIVSDSGTSNGLFVFDYFTSDKSYISTEILGYVANTTEIGIDQILTFPNKAAFCRLKIQQNTQTNTEPIQYKNIRIYNATYDQIIPSIFNPAIHQLAQVYYENNGSLASETKGEISKSYREHKYPYQVYQILDQYAINPPRRYAGTT